MKVILLKDVRSVGSHGTVKEVADGYAINFLFPQKLAEPATADKIASIEAQKEAHNAEVTKVQEELTAKIVELKGKRVALMAKATEKGGLFKAVTPKDIAKAIKAEHELDIPEEAIHIAEQIKTVGEHEVLLASKTQKVELKVFVAEGK